MEFPNRAINDSLNTDKIYKLVNTEQKIHKLTKIT